MLGPLTGSLGPLGMKARGLTAHTLTLQGTSLILDTRIIEGSPNTNHDANGSLAIGNLSGGTQRTLLIPVLTTLPDNAQITSAVLSLYATADLSGASRTFRVFRLKRAWVENQATWNSYTTGNSWQTAG